MKFGRMGDLVAVLAPAWKCTAHSKYGTGNDNGWVRVDETWVHQADVQSVRRWRKAKR